MKSGCGSRPAAVGWACAADGAVACAVGVGVGPSSTRRSQVAMAMAVSAITSRAARFTAATVAPGTSDQSQHSISSAACDIMTHPLLHMALLRRLDDCEGEGEMKNAPVMVLVVASVFAASGAAQAHVSTTPTAFAGKSSVIEVSVGHGCDGPDTYAITLDIPAGVTSVRPMWSDFGTTSMTYDAVDHRDVRHVAEGRGQRPASRRQLLPARLPGEGAGRTVLDHLLQGAPGLPRSGLDARVRRVGGVARRGGRARGRAIISAGASAGWNRYTVPVDIADLGLFFPDALIVWRGSDAYSFNDNTVELIGETSGVGLLPIDGVKANDEVWVRY